jgi:hypothetical protein
MQTVSGDPNQYSSSDLATVDHIRDEAKKLYSLYIVQKVKFSFVPLENYNFIFILIRNI